MRINGISVTDPREGLFYLLRRCPERGSESYILSESPGRTNQSHVEKFDGWLGSTNGVSWYAEEAIEVKRVASGRWSVRRFDADDLAADEEAEVVE